MSKDISNLVDVGNAVYRAVLEGATAYELEQAVTEAAESARSKIQDDLHKQAAAERFLGRRPCEALAVTQSDSAAGHVGYLTKMRLYGLL